MGHPRPKRLTARREQFCIEVVKSRLTYSEAYRRAFTATKMKPETIWEESSRMAARPEVAARIKELQERQTERLLMSRQQWLEKLDRMALADIRTLYDQHGNVIEIHALGEGEADMVEGIEVMEVKADDGKVVGRTKKIKLASKRAILKDYGEARGWVGPQEYQEADGPRTIIIRKFVNQEVNYHGQPHNAGIIDMVSNNGSDGTADRPRAAVAGDPASMEEWTDAATGAGRRADESDD